jgi:hypothetical protein
MITLGPSLMSLRGTQITGSIICTLVTEAIVNFFEYRLRSTVFFIVFFHYDLQKTTLNLFSSLYISSGT